MNPQLIEQIKNGTPLHNDIDNVELLRKVCFEAGKCYPVKNNDSFYILGKFCWIGYNRPLHNPIKLSSFLEPKMVEVEKLEAFIEENMFGIGYIDCVSLFQFIKDNKQ